MTEMLDNADITAQLESEIQALNGGINPSNEWNFQQDDFESEEDQNQDPQQDENQEEEEQEDDWKENKTEKKIKKLLSQRNAEKTEKQNLAERLTKLENELADTNFYKDNNEAIKYKDEISKMVNERGFTRDEAFLLIAWRQVLEQNKKLSSNKTTHIWFTPWINKNWTNPKDMPMADLDNLVKNMYTAWNLAI